VSNNTSLVLSELPTSTPHELVEKLVAMLSSRHYSHTALTPSASHALAKDVVDISRLAGAL
jgi:hypothetical protein